MSRDGGEGSIPGGDWTWVGYNLPTSYRCAPDTLQVFNCEIGGQYISDSDPTPKSSAIAVFGNSIMPHRNDVLMLQGPMSLYWGIRLTPVYGLAPETPDILGTRSLLSGCGHQGRVNAQCALSA
jgi:hypothetical protein